MGDNENRKVYKSKTSKNYRDGRILMQKLSQNIAYKYKKTTQQKM